MDWLFSINPSVVIGLVSALGCFYFLCICAEETKTLLAYHRAARLGAAERLPRHLRVHFPRAPRGIQAMTAFK
ncbi:MAG: hypothetical protein KGH91_08325 [Rhodospirillales bacterium]|nr:hypothetical protein [Rhodospirillales bacterium]